MANLLHISDLHLGTGDADEEFGDHKLEVIRRADRQTRLSTIRTTLRALAAQLRVSNEDLDAVVVSGDVSYQGRAEGFTMLEDLLAELGDRLPPATRIVVVPGNHDVAWYTEPGSKERYESFVREVRAKGYVTPNLEGVDLTSGELSDANSPVLVAKDETFVIVALNSSNNCGVTLDLGDLKPDIERIRKRWRDASAKRILGALNRATRFDVARVGDSQREAASIALAGAISGLDRAPIRIAVLHHQLLPISLEEEVKPFESLVNLAQVRDWLASNEIDLVLHGHKHVARAYEDWYLPLGAGSSVQEPRKLIVSAVGTVGLGQPSSNCVARLVKFDPDRVESGRIDIVDVPGLQPGVPLTLGSLPRHTFAARATRGDSIVIRGSSSQQVHEQLLDLATAVSPLSGPVICHVTSPVGADKMPRSYASLPDVPTHSEWFAELVDLWQRSPRLSTMSFNHGERIFAMNGLNQMAAAIDALEQKESSSRAVISLFDPNTDKIDGPSEFPAFCIVQLVLSGTQLQIVAYFRKQEIRYWWPINLAELAQLQQFAVEQLNGKRGNTPVTAGPITTVTAIPAAGSSVPRVAIPNTDRWVDDAPQRLLRMAVVLLDPSIQAATPAIEDWQTLATECQPKVGRAADGAPIPVAGLFRLRQELGRLIAIYGPNPLAQHADALLQRVYFAGQQIADGSRRDVVEQSQVAEMGKLHGELVALVGKIERSAQSTPTATTPRIVES